MEMQLSDNVQNILGEIIIYNHEHPYNQHLMGYMVKEKELVQLEMVLNQIFPNIIITHSLTDTETDKQKQDEKLKMIYSKNMYPYYIDLNVKAAACDSAARP